MPWFTIKKNWKGEEYGAVLIYPDKYNEPAYSDRELYRVAITEEQAAWPVAELTRLFYKDLAITELAQADAKKIELTPEKRLELINRFVAIIKQSNQEGEVASARTMFKKFTGKDYVD